MTTESLGTAASVVLDLVNASISLARGNYLDAAVYGLFAIPFIGDVAAAGRLGTQLAKQAGGLSVRAARGAGKNGVAQLTVRHRSILGQTGGNCLTNSFAGDTGVVTGVDEHGNAVTTAIEDLQVGDVVLAQDELNPDADPHYALVTGVSSRTVYEVHTPTYTDAQGNAETLQTTANHEFFAITPAGEARWTTAEQLKIGDQLLLPDASVATVTTNTISLEICLLKWADLSGRYQSRSQSRPPSSPARYPLRLPRFSRLYAASPPHPTSRCLCRPGRVV